MIDVIMFSIGVAVGATLMLLAGYSIAHYNALSKSKKERKNESYKINKRSDSRSRRTRKP